MVGLYHGYTGMGAAIMQNYMFCSNSFESFRFCATSLYYWCYNQIMLLLSAAVGSDSYCYFGAVYPFEVALVSFVV